MELGVQGVALHGEPAVPGDKLLPGHRRRPLVEGLEAPGREGSQQDQHPLGAAQADIQPGQIRQGPAAQNPAVFHPDILEPQTAELVPHQALQAEQAWNRKRQHVRTPLFHQSITGMGKKGNGEAADPAVSTKAG